MRRGKTDQAWARAAEALLDRGWGRPTQPLAGEGGGLRIIINEPGDNDSAAG